MYSAKQPFGEVNINTYSACQNKTRPPIFAKPDHMKSSRSQRRRNAHNLKHPHDLFNQEMLDEGRRRLDFGQENAGEIDEME